MRLLGIDEAGRGCIAGPLCVAGAVLHDEIKGLTDSKKLSEKKREELFPLIQKNSDYHVVFKSAKEVDKKGISTCMKEALEEILQKLSHDKVIFDGNTTFGVIGLETLVKADLKVPAVSGASILAKVSRDRYMKEVAKKYPHYGFEKHKGYGTKAHRELIAKHGQCNEHRKSFKIKSLQQGSLFDF
jgi:ribonuclease HII